MIVIGIDPGITKTHAVCISGEHLLSHFALDVPKLTTQKGRDELGGMTRPQYIGDKIEEWLDLMMFGSTVIHAFIEEPIVAGARNLRTAISMGRAAGAIEQAIVYNVKSTQMVAVDSWKKGVCGKGGIGKQDVNDWVRENHPRAYKSFLGNQDLCDAYCIARYGMAVTEEDLRGGAVHPNTPPSHRSVGRKGFTTARRDIRGGSIGSTDDRSSEPVREPRNPKLARGGIVRKGVV